MNSLQQLPAGELILKGLDDHAAGRVTPESCLIAIGWPRLARAGVDLRGQTPFRIADPERRLYHLIGAESGDAYSRYNSYLRQLVSFESALEQQIARSAVAAKRMEPLHEPPSPSA